MFPCRASFSGLFDEIFIDMPQFHKLPPPLKPTSPPCVTLAYSQLCHILSPSIFRTEGLLNTLSNNDQAYSEPCHKAVLSHIQAYSEPCATLTYAETWHTRNPGTCITLPLLHLNVYSELCYINENLRIFRTLTYLKPNTYSEPSQRFKIEFFGKIELFGKIEFFGEIFPKCSIIDL